MYDGYRIEGSILLFFLLIVPVHLSICYFLKKWRGIFVRPSAYQYVEVLRPDAWRTLEQIKYDMQARIRRIIKEENVIQSLEILISEGLVRKRWCGKIPLRLSVLMTMIKLRRPQYRLRSDYSRSPRSNPKIGRPQYH